VAISFTESFWSENGRNLRKPDLICLRQDAALYNILLLQLKAEIDYDNTGIWIADEELANSKFSNFINLAVAQNVELAITPEYSCPWDTIDILVKENKLPNEGNLWVIGCESISPVTLKTFIESHAQIIWIYDEHVLNANLNNPDRFFDPACLILKTRDDNNQIVNVITVQFKTMFFGGAGFEWERDNLIQGEKFFALSNEFASTKLVVLLCSDTLQNLDFNTLQNGFFLNSPLLLLHIQLNQRPFQANYKNYRNFIFAMGDKNVDKEVICLNWARGVTIRGNLNNWNQYGGSGFYLKSEKLNTSDERLNENHNCGLYYTNWHDKRSHIYFLNYEEQVFLLRNTKPSQRNADPTQQIRSGPEMLGVYKWNGNQWEGIEVADDGFNDLCTRMEVDCGDISCIKNSRDHINVERLIELSLGKIINHPKWYEPHNLTGLLVNDTEINQLVNFVQDPDEDTKQLRSQKIASYAYLKHSVISQDENLPETLKNVTLRFDLTLEKPERFLLNLHSNINQQHRGTGVFLGIATPTNAKTIKGNIEGLFTTNQQSKRVVVWYYHNTALNREFDETNKPAIDENVEKMPTSYKRTKER
jgi:hypothetical protein